MPRPLLLLPFSFSLCPSYSSSSTSPSFWMQCCERLHPINWTFTGPSCCCSSGSVCCCCCCSTASSSKVGWRQGRVRSWPWTGTEAGHRGRWPGRQLAAPAGRARSPVPVGPGQPAWMCASFSHVGGVICLRVWRTKAATCFSNTQAGPARIQVAGSRPPWSPDSPPSHWGRSLILQTAECSGFPASCSVH